MLLSTKKSVNAKDFRLSALANADAFCATHLAQLGFPATSASIVEVAACGTALDVVKSAFNNTADAWLFNTGLTADVESPELGHKTLSVLHRERKL